MKSINKIFVEFDNLLKEKRLLALSLNNNDSWSGNIGDRMDYNPENLPFKNNEKYPLIHQTTNPDHNGYYNVFLFHTTNIYRHTSEAHRNDFMKTTELRKVLYKDNNVEVGITIENSLRQPTKTCWGWSWDGFQYYIIKDGNTTFTKTRSVIRKIYNNKPIKTGCDVIRFENSRTFLSTEIIEINELFDKKVFHVNTVDGDFIVGHTDDVWKWMYDMYDGEEYLDWWVNEYSDGEGAKVVIKDFFAGRKFNKEDYLYHNYELKDILPYSVIEQEENWRVNSCTWDVDNDVRLKTMDVIEIKI